MRTVSLNNATPGRPVNFHSTERDQQYSNARNASELDGRQIYFPSFWLCKCIDRHQRRLYDSDDTNTM